MPVRRASSQLSEALVPKRALRAAAAQLPRSPRPAQAAQPAEQHSELANEVKDMRRMLEAQLATLAWNDMSRRSPLQAAMLKELAQLGITQDLADSLARKIPAEPQFLRRAPLRARDHRAHRAGHRRSLARDGRPHRLRRSRRRRQDHVVSQARRALGAASWPAPRGAGVGRRGAHRRARTDAHAGTPARRHRAHGLRRRANCPNCWTNCPASSSCSSTPRARARAIRISRAACAC